MATTRNVKIDIVRGMAILMVLMGHTLSSFTDHGNSLLCNIIFSVQMPLFMIISGYVCKYSTPVENFRGFGKRLWKRTYSLLLPWVVWTVLRFLLTPMEQSVFSYLKYIIFHMDSGYWFLVSLWTIDFIVSLSDLTAHALSRKRAGVKTLLQIGAIVILFIALAGLGLLVGMNAFAIKLSLYYLPFYCLGYYAGVFGERIWNTRAGKVCIDVFIALALVAYAVLITRFQLQELPESLGYIALRILVSLLGSAILFYAVDKIPSGKWQNGLILAGQYSLELYVLHILFLNILSVDAISLFTIEGAILCVVNYVLCVVCSVLIVYIIHLNKYAKFVLFGKK